MINFLFRLLLCLSVPCFFCLAEERIPFYEDYIEDGNLQEYLKLANQYLDEKPNSNEAPRLALDLMMMGKAAEDFNSVVRGTDLLLFDYLGSLPSLHFISSFDKGSPRLSQLLHVKLSEADLSDANFPSAYANTIILLARIHGPELINDPFLLLSSYLVVEQTDKKDLVESLAKALEITQEKNAKLRPLIDICKAETGPLEKLTQLHLLTSLDTTFFVRFYTSQLTEEQKRSTDFLESMVQSTLFGVPAQPELALSYLSDLPENLSNLPKYKVFTALVHLLKGNIESSTTILSPVADLENSDSDPWIEIAKSLKDGSGFSQSRKSLFLEQIEKLFERWLKGSNAFLVEGTWNDSNASKQLNFILGVSKEDESVEIHFLKKDQPYFCYKVAPQNCMILTPSGKNLLFNSGGAYPLPKIEITRDVEGGSFHYNFNLNFGRNFEDLTNQMEENLAISYLSTATGREVLLNHFFDRKGVWLSAPASSSLGTVFNINKIDPKTGSQISKIEISASGDLISLNLGKLRISKFLMGEKTILSNLPQWEKSEVETIPEFQLPLLIESIGTLIESASKK